ncbi:MAG: hypothetical protein GY795_45360 [Desulfobacterales bacterium]|nr:hypothetical protein [Desulfobacterales bacterium]
MKTRNGVPLYITASYGDCNTVFRFPAVKILDYRKKTEELEKSDNPFAIVVLAHLRNLETKKDSQRRRHWKVELVKELYRRGFSESDVRNLFDFIDWLLALPEELENSFYHEIIEFEEKQKMRFINIAERTGMKKGKLIGEILMAQRLNKWDNYSFDDLEKKDMDELKSIFAEIENKLNISYEH